jgi:hypothetical protein
MTHEQTKELQLTMRILGLLFCVIFESGLRILQYYVQSEESLCFHVTGASVSERAGEDNKRSEGHVKLLGVSAEC